MFASRDSRTWMKAVREAEEWKLLRKIWRERKVKEKIGVLLGEREMVFGTESPTMNETKFASNVKKIK